MSDRPRFFTPMLGALTLALALPLAAAAQDNGLIRGAVTDDSGAIVPGATVTLLGEAIIGGTRSTVTNESGVFRFPALPPGDYAVEVALGGFDTVRFENVRIGINTAATLDASLSLSGVTETVQVVAEAPLLDVGSNAAITTFSTEFVEELPTERNFYDYIHIAPGMTQMNSGGGGDRTIAFGSNQQSNSWNVDGIEASAPETGSSWWDPNVDMIEEVEIIGIGAPAEFGNFTGGVFNIVTKKAAIPSAAPSTTSSSTMRSPRTACTPRPTPGRRSRPRTRTPSPTSGRGTATSPRSSGARSSANASGSWPAASTPATAPTKPGTTRRRRPRTAARMTS